MKYYKNLDFLRFVAVFLVIMQHWILKKEYFFDVGTTGVTIFFVLSGFLITKILLKSKDNVEEGVHSLTKAFSNFYIRRSIRIFPIYYGLFLFLFLFNYQTALDYLPWFLSYSSNIKTYIDQSWLDTLGPLWSLAVEEQFYFIWPSIILLTTKKYIKQALIICICLGPVFRLISMCIAIYTFENVNLKISSMVLMPANIDLFAIGGLLAYNVYNKVDFSFSFHKYILISSFLLFGLISVFHNSIFYHMFFIMIIAIWSFYIIKYLITEEGGVYNSLFQFKPLSFLGKISYGLYLFHGPFFFIFGTLVFVEQKFFDFNIIFHSYHDSNHLIKLKNIGYLIFICFLSWYLFEKPINKLKRYFI
jgi:peptidoglycan/LPS O-acetylase OafA/YrhL